MFPFRYSTIFRSRWMALLWAAGICWAAISFVPAPVNDDNVGNASAATTDDPINSADVRDLEAMVDNLTK